MAFHKKLIYVFVRIYYYVNELPSRIIRLFFHLIGVMKFFSGRIQKSTPHLFYWILELFFLILDIIAFPDLYEVAIDLLKKDSRALNEGELIEAKKVFGEAIDFSRVRIDEKARIAVKKHHFAYVSFYTINLHGELRHNLLIHELVHVWQYAKYGSVYIPKALLAQRSAMKYDYGGLGNLIKNKSAGKGIDAFNFEQQAEIVCDYYKLKTNQAIQWGNATKDDLDVYQYFIDYIYS